MPPHILLALNIAAWRGALIVLCMAYAKWLAHAIRACWQSVNAAARQEHTVTPDGKVRG